MTKPASEENTEMKFVYHKLDPNIIRSMTVMALAGASEMQAHQIQPRRDDAYLDYLLSKANIGGDLGGAKLSFVLVTLLRDLFVNVMKQDPQRAEVLCEMVFTMAAGHKFTAHEPVEGPKRG